MGLGTLLLNTNEAAARLRGNGAVAQPAPAPAAEAVQPSVRATASAGEAEASFTPIADFQLTEDANQADFAIMWPALGCPQLIDPENLKLELILFSKQEPAAVNNDYILGILQHILVLEWDAALEPYRQDNKPWNLLARPKTTLAKLLKPGDSLSLRSRPMALTAYRDTIKNRPLQLGELLHTMADVVPKAYLKNGFKSVVSVRLKLQTQPAAGGFTLQPDRLYNLFYGPENGLLRGILGDTAILDKPYDDVPLLPNNFIGGHNLVYGWRFDHTRGAEKSVCGDRRREHEVRLFHPFMIVRDQARNYLNVGHITDLHTSTLWDFFDEKIFLHYNQDRAEVADNTGRDPENDADTTFTPAARRYNNPNLNARHLTHLLNRLGRAENNPGKFVDILLQTGDLIDFNRGFNLNPRHSPDDDYIFNLSWIRYYELLLLDYQRPTYTLLGNHDWRLNPYPPRIQAEAVHSLLLLYLLLVAGGTGAACGTVWGAFQAAKGDSDAVNVAIFLFQMLLAPFTGSLSLFAFLTLLGGIGLDLDITADVLFSKMGLGIILGGGWLLGHLFHWIFVVINAISENTITDAGSGALWGAIAGGTLGCIGAIVVAFLLFKARDYMTHITNLTSDDFSKLFDDKNVGYLRAFGKDGVLYMTERSIDWYALVINPFLDYGFRHGNTSIMMADWGGSEILTGDPPLSDDAFTDRQWELLNNWLDTAIHHRRNVPVEKGVIPILGLHTPVFCPLLDENLDTLHRNGAGVDDDKLGRGTMEERRQELIDLYFRLAAGLRSDGKPIAAVTLTGHTHDYDLFRTETLDKATWYQLEHFGGKPPGFWNKGLHITTSCAGPPGDGTIPEGEDKTAVLELLKEYDRRQDNAFDDPGSDPRQPFRQLKYKKGDRVPRPPGCRVLRFDPADGSIISIEEISAITGKWGNS